MRSASRPRTASAGTRCRKAMSSSMLMRRRKSPSRHQLVSAAFRDKNRGRGSILLDLLPQAIDVGLERVRGDAGIVAPHFLQQHFARHRTLPGAVEKAQDRGLLLG